MAQIHESGRVKMPDERVIRIGNCRGARAILGGEFGVIIKAGTV
jgi:hypothetical protein